MGERRPDRNGSNVLADGARDKHGKSKQWCATPDESGGRWGSWTIKYGRQETGDRLRGNLQIAEEGKGDLRHMRRDGAGVLS